MTGIDKRRPVAVVTGGGGAIGRSIALRLARDWDTVAVVDLDAETGSETARLLQAAGSTSIFVRADVSQANDVERYVDHIEHALGPIGAFSNNAGIEGVVAPIHEYPEEAFERTFQVNTRGVFLGLKYVLATMLRRGVGAVVNTASTSSIRGRAGLAGYVASKHAVLGLTRVAALDVAGSNIRVNAVLPGPIESRMLQSLNQQAGASTAGFARAGTARHGAPDSVANVVAFLLSPDAAHVNGAAWTVDAGSTVG
jgi:NAD(P)-dependent dehydrogenase (short-subunit alcohol dehydrogenase family)